MNPLYKTQLHSKQPDLIVWEVGDLTAPSRGTLDPEILLWCEEHGFTLVTNNRKSMPVHLAEHIEEGHHISGIFILSKKLTIGQHIDELILLALASFEGDYRDCIIHLPYSYSLPSEFI